MDVQILKNLRRRQLLLVNGLIVAATLLLFVMGYFHLELIFLAFIWIAVIGIALKRKEQGKDLQGKDFLLFPSLRPLVEYEKKVLGSKYRGQNQNPFAILIAVSAQILLLRSKSLQGIGGDESVVFWTIVIAIVLSIVNIALIYNYKKVDRVSNRKS